MRMDLGTRNTLLYDFMHCMTAVSLEMSDEPSIYQESVGYTSVALCAYYIRLLIYHSIFRKKPDIILKVDFRYSVKACFMR